MVCLPQFFGDKVNPHIHLHCLCTDGAFDKEGNFYYLPVDANHDIDILKKLFEKRVLDLLVAHERLSPAFHDEMLAWDFTGFSVDASIKVYTGEWGKLHRLVRYMARPGIAQDRVNYDEHTGQVTVRSAKRFDGIRPVVAHYDVMTFLGLLTQQIPPPYLHMVRYYGWYSIRKRAHRRKLCVEEQPIDVPKEIDPPSVIVRRQAWARLLQKVFEVDPLRCERCGSVMRIVSFITTSQQQVLHQILDHLQMDIELPQSTGPPLWYQKELAKQHIEEYQDWYHCDVAYDEPVWDYATM